LLLPDLLARLKPGEEGGLPARVRVVTSDYLDVTDPEALRSLMLLQDDGAQVRVYESAGSSFHMKAYLFATQDADGQLLGQEPIGLYPERHHDTSDTANSPRIHFQHWSRV
jgi:hypothetical protein